MGLVVVFLLFPFLQCFSVYKNAYGERFSIDGACNALDSMVRAAELAKRELIEAKRKES